MMTSPIEEDLEITFVLKGSLEDSVVPNGYLIVSPVKLMGSEKFFNLTDEVIPSKHMIEVSWGKLSKFTIQTRFWPQWRAQFYIKRQNGTYSKCLEHLFKTDTSIVSKTLIVPS